jgi:hypothetical protein
VKSAALCRAAPAARRWQTKKESSIKFPSFVAREEFSFVEPPGRACVELTMVQLGGWAAAWN